MTSEERTQKEMIQEEEEVRLEDLEEGNDFAELFKESGTNLLTFEHKGKRWTFKIRSVGWDEHFTTIENNYIMTKKLNQDTGRVEEEPGFNTKQYYEDIFMLAIVEGPGKQGVTRQMLRQLDAAIIHKLVSVVPGPKLQDDLYEIKKA